MQTAREIAYEEGRKALETPKGLSTFLRQGKVSVISNQASGRADYLMAFAVRFVRRENSKNALLDAPGVHHLTQGERKACAILHDILCADAGSILDIMSDHPRVAETAYGLFKFRDMDDMARELLDDTCQARLNDPFGSPLAGSVIIMRAFVQNEAAGRRADAGPQTIETTDPTFLAWQEKAPDPDLWHQMLNELNYDIPGNVALLHWVVRQPSCDRATAAALFLMLFGQHMVGMPSLAVKERFPGSLVFEICDRATKQGFARSELSLASVGFANDQRPLLNEMRRLYEERADMAKDCIPVPVALFERPVAGRAPSSSYYAHSESFVTLSA
ncbi:DUF4274 domain-containing protein [Marivita hallyeonensis]|uniref:DUF4274 domain-containing protein n=1 Tax=Marivita hallyeonensis TaxID=996342 RepID=A0A1M5VY08_9RHOB|nr:DUF4274 domain-containing protein [Marivita hallyeonensis]SHH80078.1 protein of unknown function [Marivita hallyeonensis]